MNKARAKPIGTLVKGARIHLDMEIDLEVAKFLGVPFTYGLCGRAVKYVRTSWGTVKLGRILISYREDHESRWSESQAEYLDVDKAALIHVLHPVEFDGEEPINLD